MATYNVGNVEIEAKVNSKTALANIDGLISKLEQLQNTANNKININFKKTNQSLKETTKQVNNLKLAFNTGMMIALVNNLKYFSQYFSKFVNDASDYAEILNKFQISFNKINSPESYQKNLEFIDKLSKTYGFSRQVLMDYTATFNNMLKSLKGLTDDGSAMIARTLTQMAIDYSSLFNTSIESTMLAFQSMLSGSIRPIRGQSGFDVSDTTIMALYKEFGGTKSSRQLSQIEKRLLRIIAVEQQLEKVGATGDFGRTIENYSNQIKILQSQLTEFGATWGQLILYNLKPVVQFINGLLMALNELGKQFIKLQEDAEGIDYSQEFGGLKDTADIVDNVSESVDNLTGELLGLDQINTLGSSTSGVNGALSIDPVITDHLKEYYTQLDKINMKAKDIAKSILSFFGYEYDSNGKLQKINNRLEIMKEVLLAIVGIGVASWIIKIGSSLLTVLKSVNTINNTKFIQNITNGILVSSLIQLVLRWNDLSTAAKTTYIILAAIATTINVVMNWAKIVSGIKTIIASIKGLNLALSFLSLSLTSIVTTLGVMIASIAFVAFLDKIPTQLREIATALFAAASMAMIAAGAFMVFHSTASLGTAIPLILGGIAAGYAAIKGYSSTMSNDLAIPQLAKGGVLDNPTTVQVAEYAGAKRNPEIVTPENKMREVFLEGQIPVVNAIYRMGDMITKAYEENNEKPIVLNGRKVSEQLYDDLNAVSMRKGKNGF
jgi:hypothetical protein